MKVDYDRVKAAAKIRLLQYVNLVEEGGCLPAITKLYDCDTQDDITAASRRAFTVQNLLTALVLDVVADDPEKFESVPEIENPS